ncbi:hypothetical protein HPB51_019990 [Rhipicephalus microplus]|uniref:HTH CENPB-type domain-containing protein n=1 Tax=Rhipicephalus microplus TaxID=6941 RepID=A0A9J6DC43_RHIMP|nr:hypothetical protein HPB51_019990 [Rhipicephalus microplus]
MNAIQRRAKKSVLAREEGLPLSTVCGIRTARENVLNGTLSNLKRCRLRGSSYLDVKEALMHWLKNARARNLPVSGPLLTGKALVFATLMGHDSFVCSSGWLARFKTRYNLTMKVVSGEGAAADKASAEDWTSGKLQNILQEYAAVDIFNVDESAL